MSTLLEVAFTLFTVAATFAMTALGVFILIEILK